MAWLVTIYTVFVIELASRRVQILGSTPHPDEAFMRQVARTLTMTDGEACRALICDRDAKWSAAVHRCLQDAGLRVIQTPQQDAMTTPRGQFVLLRHFSRCVEFRARPPGASEPNLTELQAERSVRVIEAR